ncbi:multifunctional oxoglutarate decarboxylase/oxoglutarate dehydrogenase thiamine pyrophosphate-binding subunit/dihydrolipoyllysine-residue succinyltransferase subunit, partial [Kitasatospora sp. SUK 42]|nr:multifunctional oxoglutarate decarboxylase/oxoglutarate dehydrogenase thiamine pyrophosphate-binding subunit/dihydrolipoyllysine-residue succinyltransferase subunit [Kitasatospora sp. SUK 42]
PVIGDSTVDPAQVRKVVITAGKFYYDLEAARTERGVTDTAIVRVERLYPLPVAELRDELARYGDNVQFVWAQEEPANQGAWPFIAMNLVDHLDVVIGRGANVGRLLRVARPASSAPAVGSAKRHAVEQQAVIDEVFTV